MKAFIFLGLLAMIATSDAQKPSVEPRSFGMHEHNLAVNGWPTVPVGSFRIVGDQVPNVSWYDLEPTRGHYDWSKLDALIDRITSHEVDIVYTFRKMPPWASSKPNGSCGEGIAGTCFAPANPQDWKDFVQAITSRYRGRIKYWELWNEPNAANFWSGPPEQLVSLAREAYPIITAAGGVVVSPCPQGTTADRWLNAYFEAGGGAYVDVIAFHGYLGKENLEPGYGSLVKRMRAVMSEHGQGTKELWDTEHSWFGSLDRADEKLEASWMVRHLLLGFAGGVSRSFWYAWSDAKYGALYDKVNHVMLPAGNAYLTVYRWLNGANFAGACSGTGPIWTCNLTLADGTAAQAMWDSSKSCSGHACDLADRSVAKQWTQYNDLAGNSVPIIDHRVSLGIEPILLKSVSIP